MKTCKLLVLLAALLAPAIASGDPRSERPARGVNVSAGGGLVQFVDRDMRGRAAEGGGWEVRLGVGTRTPIAIEAAYVGSLHAVDALGLDARASLLGTGVEGDLRLNMLTGDLQPYALAGVGWTRYSLVHRGASTSDVADHDNVGALPMGVGVTFRQDALTLDVRAVYRRTIAVDMFPGASDDSLATWSATLRVGFEY